LNCPLIFLGCSLDLVAQTATSLAARACCPDNNKPCHITRRQCYFLSQQELVVQTATSLAARACRPDSNKPCHITRRQCYLLSQLELVAPTATSLVKGLRPMARAYQPSCLAPVLYGGVHATPRSAGRGLTPECVFKDLADFFIRLAVCLRGDKACRHAGVENEVMCVHKGTFSGPQKQEGVYHLPLL